MDDLPRSKKAVLYIGQFLATAVMYGIVMYFLDSFFESSRRYTPKSIFIQSVIFGALFTLYTTWSNNRKQQELNPMKAPKSKIDTSKDFTLDCPGYWDWQWTGICPYRPILPVDPDTMCKSLIECHQAIWSKPLPNGEVMDLKVCKYSGYYLKWKGLLFSSDSLIVSLCYERLSPVLSQLFPDIEQYRRYLVDFQHRTYTLGGMIIWPCHRNSINQAKGTNKSISDRLDRTLECIRKYYNREDSPLYKILCNDKWFFDLFIDFRGFVDFFHLNDLVSSDYNEVVMWIGNNDLTTPALPQNVEEYWSLINGQLDFLSKRNSRIQTWADENC